MRSVLLALGGLLLAPVVASASWNTPLFGVAGVQPCGDKVVATTGRASLNSASPGGRVGLVSFAPVSGTVDQDLDLGAGSPLDTECRAGALWVLHRRGAGAPSSITVVGLAALDRRREFPDLGGTSQIANSRFGLWGIDPVASRLLRIDVRGRINRRALPGRPKAVAADGNRVWVAFAGGIRPYVIVNGYNARTGALLHRVRLSWKPGRLVGIAATGGAVMIGQHVLTIGTDGRVKVRRTGLDVAGAIAGGSGRFVAGVVAGIGGRASIVTVEPVTLGINEIAPATNDVRSLARLDDSVYVATGSSVARIDT